MNRILFNEAEAREALGGIGRTKFWELVRDSHLSIVKIGRRTFITHEELERYVATLTKANRPMAHN